jgi:hypothetical protein
MNVKCISTSITVFGCGQSYQSSVADYITVGNVYETTGSFHDRYFKILHDKGKATSEFPTYIFEETYEPVTININRDQEQEQLIVEEKRQIEKQLKDQEQQQISDNLERFYNPHNFQKIQENRFRTRKILSNIFVGGIPFDHY